MTLIAVFRPPTTQRTRLYRFLEDGAAGLLVPFVSDADTAREIVLAAKYPPIGNRGLDGAGLDADFGLDSWRSGSTYIADANRETFIVAQIETPEAVANADEIAAVEGIDALFVGPADLGLRLETYPEIWHELLTMLLPGWRRRRSCMAKSGRGLLPQLKRSTATGVKARSWCRTGQRLRLASSPAASQ